MIVNVRLPKEKTALSYGAARVAVNAGGTVDVPLYVAARLVAAGGQADLPVPSLAFGDLLALAEPWQMGWFIHGHGALWGFNPFTDFGRPPYDAKAHALGLFDKRGEPALIIT